MTLDECRRFYAEEIRFAANLKSPALTAAFERVPRERFLGPGPWKIATDAGMGEPTYVEAGEPRHLYHNVMVALDPERGLNNGHPGSLARCIDALDIKAGDRVFHVGCGAGYYTAILAEVAGPGGHVVAVEVDADLAERAKENLAQYSSVTVHSGDGAALDPGPCDAILINAGVTHPHRPWIERLNAGGRLVLPLTYAVPGKLYGVGVMAKIVSEPGGLSLQIVAPMAIYSCASVRDAHEPNGECVAHGPDVCLSARPFAAR
jgi:protein-L-isoaspartate(D-aspartate) O-methyltransferase